MNTNKVKLTSILLDCSYVCTASMKRAFFSRFTDNVSVRLIFASTSCPKRDVYKAHTCDQHIYLCGKHMLANTTNITHRDVRIMDSVEQRRTNDLLITYSHRHIFFDKRGAARNKTIKYY